MGITILTLEVQSGLLISKTMGFKLPKVGI